jgi:hypothetical protein
MRRNIRRGRSCRGGRRERREGNKEVGRGSKGGGRERELE